MYLYIVQNVNIELYRLQERDFESTPLTDDSWANVVFRSRPSALATKTRKGFLHFKSQNVFFFQNIFFCQNVFIKDHQHWLQKQERSLPFHIFFKQKHSLVLELGGSDLLS